MYDSNDGDVSRTREIIEATRFASEDADHVLRRQFQRLHLYNLYSKHNKLVKLDEKVGEMESAVTPGMDGRVSNPASAIQQAGNLDKLLLEISEAIQEFEMASRAYKASMTAPKLSTHTIEQLKGVSELNAASYKEQYDRDGWSECALHFVTDHKGRIHRAIDYFGILRMLLAKKPKEQRGVMIHYSEALARSIDDIVVNVVFCMLVIGPIAFLSYLQDKAKKLIIVAVFILLSAVVSSFLANVKHKTSLTMIAAYTAILVVFLGSNPGN